MAIAADDDWALLGMQGIEGVQELFLRGRLFRQEVAGHQARSASHSRKCFAKGAKIARVNRLHEAIGEILGGEIADAPIGPSCGASQDRCPPRDASCPVPTGPCTTRGLGSCSGASTRLRRSRMSDAVARADDEIVEPAKAPWPSFRLDALGGADFLWNGAVAEEPVAAAPEASVLGFHVGRASRKSSGSNAKTMRTLFLKNLLGNAWMSAPKVFSSHSW